MLPQAENFISENYPAVIDFKLAFREKTRFYYTPVPNWIRYHPDLSDADKQTASELVKLLKMNEAAWVSVSEDYLASQLGKSVRSIRRSISSLIEKRVVVRKFGGDGRCAQYAFLCLPSMNLDPDQIARIDDPTDLQKISGQIRPVRRAAAGNQTGQIWPVRDADPVQTGQNRSADRTNLAGLLKTSFKKEKEHEEKAGMAMPAEPQTGQNGFDPISDQIGGSGGTGGLEKADPPAQVRSATAEPASAQQPLSKHSLETCLKFAYSEKQRRGTISNPKKFADSCYENGRQDKEIDDWLKKRAELFVGGEPPKSVDPAPQSRQSQFTSAPYRHMTDPSAAQDPEAEALMRQLELDRLREEAFNALPFQERQKLTEEKIALLLASEHAEKYRRMPQETLIEKAAYEAQKEIALPGEFKAPMPIRFFSSAKAAPCDESTLRSNECGERSEQSAAAAAIGFDAATAAAMPTILVQASPSAQQTTAADAQLPVIAQTPARQGKVSSEPADRLPAASEPFHFDSESLCVQGQATSDSDVVLQQNGACESDSEAARLTASGSEGKSEQRPNALIRSAGFKEQAASAKEVNSFPSAARSSAYSQRQSLTCGISAKAEEIAMGLNREFKGKARLPFLDYLEEVKSRLSCKDADEIGITLSPALKKIWKSGQANGPP